MLFGSNRDFELLVKVNRELLKDIVEQEILFYKLNLEETDANIYGEALTKTYFVPSKLNCLITRGDQVVSIDDFTLPDLQREASFAFLRPDLEDISLLPEVGDIINWQEDYYGGKRKKGRGEAESGKTVSSRQQRFLIEIYIKTIRFLSSRVGFG